jgi:hypothetical protein
MNTSATKMRRFTAEPGFHHGVELQFWAYILLYSIRFSRYSSGHRIFLGSTLN